MYPVSEAFHTAIKNGNPQMPLFIFDDAVITAQDIDITSQGISFSDNIGGRDDYQPGGTPSALISVSLFNEDGRFSDYSFSGRYRAMIGVQTGRWKYNDGNHCRLPVIFPFMLGLSSSSSFICRTMVGTDVIKVKSTSPYLYINKRESTVQPDFAPKAIVSYDHDVCVFGDNNKYAYYQYADGQLTAKVCPWDTAMLLRKAKYWMENRMGIQYGTKNAYSTAPLASDSLTVFQDGWASTYEFAPIGVFVADRPTFSSKMNVQLDGYDLVSTLDEKWQDYSWTFNSGTTVGSLFGQICTKFDIECAGTTFTNSTLPVKTQPDRFSDATVREVLSWIAEIAGCYAKCDRNGKLGIRWFNPVNFSVTATEYSESATAYYEAAPVNVVVIRDSNSDDKTRGTGDNKLYIQNNPIAALQTQ